MTTILHVIPTLTRGGPSRALLAAAMATSAGHRHVVVSLTAPDPFMVASMRRRGIDVHAGPGARAMSDLIRAADVVQLHFWNTPALYELLATELPAMRLLAWSHVSGEHPPQVVTPELLALVDAMVASTDYTTELDGLGDVEVVPAIAGWERVAEVAPRRGGPYTVGFIGKLDFAKLHPDFVAMCAAVPVPEARFVVCGVGSAAGALGRQAADHGIAARFELRGFVEDIGAAIAEMDVFGYPLAERTSAASELVLQEVMYAGVPPVVLAAGSPGRIVAHGETGLVATDADGYAAALAYLHEHPEERRRLGAAAHRHAVAHWSPSAVGERWAAVYETLVRRPKRTRPPYPLAQRGAERFARSLGDGAAVFLRALAASGDEAVAAEQELAAVPDMLWTGGGGISEYRDRHPDDPHLRLWCGLLLRRDGRAALAAGELAAALRLGLDEPRVHAYLREATHEATAVEVPA